MRAVLQRVSEARVEVSGKTTGEIGAGLVVLLGIGNSDSEADADYLLHKILGLRVFPDAAGKMNRSVSEVGGALLIVSQFTVYGDCTKGMRPSFDLAARPEAARKLYEYLVSKAASTGVLVQTGMFQETMRLHLVNEGPVTLICDSAKMRVDSK